MPYIVYPASVLLAQWGDKYPDKWAGDPHLCFKYNGKGSSRDPNLRERPEVEFK
jgi:hypothetical protein